ncbi:unnamed protein product [Adineta ricciae]|uniref:Uncharacterized protein n=1 Tax=Adineta ricciae TaxID=249248 RepID=A0A814VGC3_ADIRI|nr:unnamed protein product [Adineta ricciae]
MNCQPSDSENHLHNDESRIDQITIEEHLNTPLYPTTRLSFSSITDVFANDLSTLSSPIDEFSLLNEDSVDSQESLSISADIENNVNRLLHSNEFNSEVIERDFTLKSSGATQEWVEEELNKSVLEAIDQKISDRMMFVQIQPPTDIRRRYQSDGKRQIEKSRSKPMAIKLPNLETCQLRSNQSFWLQLILITSDNNPKEKVFIHPDKLEYHADNSSEYDHGFVRVPLTASDIQSGVKELARISIIKSKLDAYTFELKPFAPISGNNQSETYKNTNTKSVVATAKMFRDEYHLKSSHIACQLLIKYDNTWRTTDIFCITDLMEEKNGQSGSNKALKRSITVDDEDQIHRQKSSKKQVAKNSKMIDNSIIT